MDKMFFPFLCVCVSMCALVCVRVCVLAYSALWVSTRTVPRTRRDKRESLSIKLWTIRNGRHVRSSHIYSARFIWFVFIFLSFSVCLFVWQIRCVNSYERNVSCAFPITIMSFWTYHSAFVLYATQWLFPITLQIMNERKEEQRRKK